MKIYTKQDKKSLILRINLIAIFIAILAIFKWTLGFFPGFEVLTFFIVFFSLFMYFKDVILVTLSFSLFVCLIYGFNTWVIPYFFIFPLMATLTFIFKRVLTKNILILSVWCFALALLWTPTYFFFDLALYGKIAATANIITSIPTSMVGGLLNFGVCLLISPILSILFTDVMKRPYDLKYIKRLRNFSKWRKVWIAIGSVVSVLGIIFVEMYSIKILEIGDLYRRQHKYEYKEGYLTERQFNQIQSTLNDGECELVVLYGELTYSSTIKECGGKKLSDVLFTKDGFKDDMKIESTNPNLQTVDHKFWIKEQVSMSNGLYGSFIGGLDVVYENKKNNLSIDSECPLVRMNRQVNVGPSQLILQSKDVVQLSYYATDKTGSRCWY